MNVLEVNILGRSFSRFSAKRCLFKGLKTICYFAVRLAGGGNTKFQGRVEVFINGTWGTVCDDEWDLQDADVVCRQLGYGKAVTSPKASAFGRGQGKIWMTNVRCTGNESSITQCAYNGSEKGICSHSNDVGVVCSTGKRFNPNK